MKNKEIQIEYYRGQGPGGQSRNKTEKACRITHLPTGIVVTADGRSKVQNTKRAKKELTKRLRDLTEAERAARLKERRDEKVKNPERAIRTYNRKKSIVIDHRTGKSASWKNVVDKGRIDLLK